ncbi:hypothetical protein [Streptomyces sp. NPDC003023]|uniref:hypothetical protein n=1 Tax=Streptomyces sp. NPDC003023 TaxID=3364675 RepID=UPI00368314CF
MIGSRGDTWCPAWVWMPAFAASLLLAACAPSPGDRGIGEDRYPYWQKGAGAVDAAAFMKVEIPDGAAEVKGAVRVQPQESVYLLSFLTEERTAVAITADLRPDSPLEEEDNLTSSLSGDGFQHLGLTSPQNLDRVRTATACPPCVGDVRRSSVQAIEIHLGQVADDRVRVYLTAY